MATPVTPTIVEPPRFSEDVFIARQPIFDAKMNVVAYELLFRSGLDNHAAFPDGETATARTLMNLLVSIGPENLVGPHRAFINVTRAYLTGQKPMPIPRDQLVVEILENETIDRELIRGVADLAANGYALALDDVEDPESVAPLLDFVRIVKIEYPAISPERLRQCVERYRRHNLTILAEKIETAEDYAICRDLGIDLYQGYFFAKPQIIHGREISHDQLHLLRLLASLHDPNVSFEGLEPLICQDAALSYKLLRYINSVAMGVRQEVRSIKQALSLLGLRRVRQVATLLAIANANRKPSEILVTAMVRARTCEALASLSKSLDADVAFTIGLFSLLDAMFDQPIEGVLEHLPLDEEVRSAIIAHEGPFGSLLAIVIANEQGDHETLQQCREISAEFNQAYLKAVTDSVQTESLVTSK